MKFIHTSDWHLGRLFHNVSLLHEQAAVIQQIIHYLHSEKAEALIIAGDIYDRAIPPAPAVNLLDSVLNQLCGELNIPVVMISGNHDNPERLGFAAKQLAQAGVYIKSKIEEFDEPITLTDRAGNPVDFYGIPYHTPEEVNNVFATSFNTHQQAHHFLVNTILENALPDRKKVLITHCFVQDAYTSESERPLSVGGIDQVDAQHMHAFDYVALGHLHRPQCCGAEFIRYSGSILKYSFSEVDHQKSVQLIELPLSGEIIQKTLPLHAPRDVRILEGELQRLLDAAQHDEHCEDYVLARLTDKRAMLDVMGKLRQCYPNILQVEKHGWREINTLEVKARHKIHQHFEEMFNDFYTQVMGEVLSNQQRQALVKTIKAIEMQRREVGVHEIKENIE